VAWCEFSVAWRGVAWRGVVWRGVVWCGVAWREFSVAWCVAWRVVCGMAWCGGRGVAWREFSGCILCCVISHS